ncbi:MAG: guanylate cyclase [Betaproteobacteria bacterium RIFCSPLOWO2_12_FULL_63_13]|nr:MAG: guanylate cyclase [Betaproteobacteria bacterium RIFCSPLOWO2_02_FULL_63_19]OGA51386.1 MAG: guanylate cyclase [Betaproteobacteria bacterium RIFCSPLOWO2_12_FULL_63_13]
MRQHIVRIAIGLLVVLAFLGHVARFYQIGFITQLDNIMYDYRLRLTMPGTVDERIVILDIDEKSLAVPELGRWPWGRDKISALINKLFDKYGVVIIGFDVVWAERDESSGLKVLDQLMKNQLRSVPQFGAALENLRPQLDHDAMFAKTIAGRPVVLGYYFNSDPDARESGALPPPVLPAGVFAGRNIGFSSWNGYGGNLPELQAAAVAGGHFNPLVDFDGVSRRVPMLIEYKGKYYEPLSLAIVRLLMGLEEAGRTNNSTVKLPAIAPYLAETKSKGYGGLERIDVGPLQIPVDEHVAALIPFRGERNSFRYVSLADVYFDRVPVDTLQGRIAIVGATAPGLFDLRSTPVGSVYPGVEIHANLVAGMLDHNRGAIKQKPPYMIGAEVVLLIIIGVALTLLLPLLSPLRATLVSLVVLVLVSGFNVMIWSGANMVLPLASSVLMIAALFALNMSYGYFIESRSKRQFTELFGQYVPPELVDKMAEDPEKYSMEGRSEELTVLFSDIRGFTTISEGLDPKQLSAFINEYLTSMSLVIRNNRGTLDKYIGDAIMAFWGAPVMDPEHPRQGVLSALLMQEEMYRLSEAFVARGWPPIKIGVGLNTGVMSVGDMGSKLRRAYTVMGDAVNLGSRLEGITKQYGVGIICGQRTRELVTDVIWRELDRVRVKGKDEPIAIFEPLGFDNQVSKEKIEETKLWNQALRAYRAQDWDQADMLLLNLQRMSGGAYLYETYAERVAHYRKDPPGPDWDGVWKFETK